MTMPHIEWANKSAAQIHADARQGNPDYWKTLSAQFGKAGNVLQSGVYAVIAIAALGYWHQINGEWRRNGL